MILECCDCSEHLDISGKGLVKIGNCYHCIMCRGFRFKIVDLSNYSNKNSILDELMYEGEME